jgi:hypothetical protein
VSKSYKDSLENLSPNNLKETIETLKTRARYELLPYTIFGGLSGFLPLVDIFIQKFYINKEAIKKAAQIFKIKTEFIDEENKKEEEIKKKEGNKKNEITEPIYIKPDIEKNNLEEVKDEDLNKDSVKNNLLTLGGNIVNIGQKTANSISQASYYSAKAIEYSEKIDALAVNGYISGLDDLNKFVFYNGKLQHYEALSHGFNINFFGIGTVLSVGIGAYCTLTFCENLINKFAEYYQNNADKITNSYKEALSYFIDP